MPGKDLERTRQFPAHVVAAARAEGQAAEVLVGRHSDLVATVRASKGELRPIGGYRRITSGPDAGQYSVPVVHVAPLPTPWYKTQLGRAGLFIGIPVVTVGGLVTWAVVSIGVVPFLLTIGGVVVGLIILAMMNGGGGGGSHGGISVTTTTTVNIR